MNRSEELNYLITELCKENPAPEKIEIPRENGEKRRLLRALMNVREPGKINPRFLEVQDEMLQREAREKGIVSMEELKTVNDEFKTNTFKSMSYGNKLTLWQGDITRLSVDAIVNAANSRLLGCFVPGHNCIDNVIHSQAGIQLRNECFKLMNKQKVPEPTGMAKITSAYNLPCKYVIHTVGPIVKEELTTELEQELASSYRSCLDLAVINRVRTLAFCCISTGEFHFPNELAAQIAVATVLEYLKNHSEKFDRIIFNVFKDLDYQLYEKIFSL